MTLSVLFPQSRRELRPVPSLVFGTQSRQACFLHRFVKPGDRIGAS
ncbi:MAG: hypothetical protein ABI790_08320 [Betaproteobacteria bacterium]